MEHRDTLGRSAKVLCTLGFTYLGGLVPETQR